MAIIFDDQKTISEYFKKPNIQPKSFATMCKRQAAGLMLTSDDMQQNAKELEEIEKLQEKRYERKKKLLFDNLDLILRHKDEILATPRYANIDVHYAIKGGGCYIGPISTSRHLYFAGSPLDIGFKLSTLLEIWDTDQFKIECKCGGTAVIHYFSGSPLSGGSVATAVCSKCKEQIHGIRSRRFGNYMRIILDKRNEETEKVMKSIIAKWAQAEAEYQKKVAEGICSNPSLGNELSGEGASCNLETMINELKLKEFAETERN